MKNIVSILLICSPIFLFAQVVDSVALKKVDSLIQVSRGLAGNGDFAKALELSAAAEAFSLEKWGMESAEYGSACYNHGSILYFKDDNAGAEIWFFKSKDILEKVLGKNNVVYAKTLQSIGLLYYWMGKYSEAESPMLEALTLYEKLVGKEDAKYVYSLYWLGVLYCRMGKHEKSEPLLLQAKAIREKTVGVEHPDYAENLCTLGVLYSDMGDDENAEKFYLEAKDIRARVLGKEHYDYAASLNNLATLYWKMEDFEKAEPLYLETKEIQAKTLGKYHPYYAVTLNNLANLYQDMAEYEKAEPLYLETKEIQERSLGKEHPDYATTLTNLGNLYFQLWNLEKVEALYLEAKTIREKILGKEHADYAASLHNLATLYKEMGNYGKAESFYLEAKSIREKVFGKESRDYASSLNDLAALYAIQGMYEKAKPLQLEAMAIRQRVLGKNHSSYAKSLNTLANLYMNMGNAEQAEQLYLEAKTIREETFGNAHPDYASSLDNLTYFYWKLGNLPYAKNYILEANETNNNLIFNASHYLSERELAYYTHKFEESLNRNFSFAQIQPDISANCFNNTLFHKGFLLNAVSQVAKLALSDPITTEQYFQLKSYQRRLAAEYTKPIAERKNVAALEEKANTLEKDLTRSVAGFGEALRQVTWQEVQQKLQPGEAAIEFVHYKFVNPKPTDSIMYAALVLLPGKTPPSFIPLFEEKQLEALLRPEGKPKADFVNGLYANSTLYELLWQPLERMLSDAQTVYFSPSGLLHRLNIGAVPMPPMLRGEQAAGTLADRYRLIELGSTRQLVVPSNTNYDNKEALLYGGINYEMDSTAIASAISSLDANPLATRRGLDFSNAVSQFRGSGGRGGKWGYLRWTDVEVSSTQDILADAGLHATIRKGYDGTEESFKEIGVNGPSPRVLHLATHGFFFPDPVAVGSQQSAVENQGEAVFRISEHPMIRSGLVLAGGNYAWQTGKPFRPDREDGILTAYEISQMNLSNTELVVLSACETGLGDIQGNEGVYGLQRAFKIAGAKYLIMSLWQVPDFQTQELMSSFYSLWLEDKMTIPDAFRAAQKLMKDKYKGPFLWAGFVLVE